MIIFLYGPDTYRSRRKLNEIIENYKKVRKSGLNLNFYEGKELNFENFYSEVFSASMFAEKKLIILKNIFSNQEFKEKFSENFKKFVNSKKVILIFYNEEEISKGDKFFKLLKKAGLQPTHHPIRKNHRHLPTALSQEFKFLEDVSLKSWIKKEIERYKAKASPEAVDKLIEFAGSDSWQLSNEIQKLINYKKGREIQIKDVELLVKPEIDNNIFKTIDAIALKNKKKALELLHHHLEKGDPPLYLLNMINFQFRNLLMIKELIEKNQPYYSILRKTKLKPFVVQKTYQQVRRFSLTELKKIYQKIFQADLDIKTGKIVPETALDLLIAEI